MKFCGAFALVICLFPWLCSAGELNLATLTCSKYENEIVDSSDPSQKEDNINVVMWLFGFAVAKSGAHVMYGGALPSFGFALDQECKNNPSRSLLETLPAVKLDKSHPMDLIGLDCETFESRHVESARSDPESANTIMMWLYGYAVGQSGDHIFGTASVAKFASALQGQCANTPGASLFDALKALEMSKPWK